MTLIEYRTIVKHTVVNPNRRDTLFRRPIRFMILRITVSLGIYRMTLEEVNDSDNMALKRLSFYNSRAPFIYRVKKFAGHERNPAVYTQTSVGCIIARIKTK